ncbi:hypothetical protein HHK36_020125 [Tetracentron sinense]|uniref:Uncharacterized protein n=1 Tax=Tetracentron sinense TaxID=13715 RepID=A0A834YWS3_TETSI|nr:hypothetical protein HHK36_020125 [Tetracentron sinense]
MGGCATKPKVLKAEDNTVPEPAPAKDESCTDSDAKIAGGTEEIGAVKVEVGDGEKEKVDDDKVDEQGKKPRSLGLLLEEKNDLSGRSRNSGEEVEVLQARCHYSQAEVDGCIFNLNDDAYVKADDLPVFIWFHAMSKEPSRGNDEEKIMGSASSPRNTLIREETKMWEALALVLIGISVNQMRSLPEGTSALGLPIATGAYVYTLIFWEALALLLIGISVNQMRSLPEGTSVLGLPIATGAYVFTLIFVTVPSLASVFNEDALKSQFEASIYLQNLFLYGYGAIFNFLAILGTVVIKGPSSFDILQGHSKATMFLIFNNAAQGIPSSFFFKYADYGKCEFATEYSD